MGGGVLPPRCFQPPYVLTWRRITPVTASLWPSYLDCPADCALGTIDCVPLGHPSLPVNLIALLAPNLATYFQL